MIRSVNDVKYRAFIAQLKAARVSQGLTVRDLGSRIEEPNQFVSKIETGQRKLTVQEFVQYCRALGVEPNEMLKYLD